MDNEKRWMAHIRALIYPIQFAEDPIGNIDRILRMLVEQRPLNSGPHEYLTSIRKALASDIPLASLIPQNHSEETVRSYLSELEKRLVQRNLDE